MADQVVVDRLVLSHLLCFVITKFGKLDMKSIKRMTADFYTQEEVTVAKKLLLDNVEQMKLDKPLSRFPGRQGTKKTEREIDDIMDILTELDECMLFNKLPCYVTNNSEKLPITNVMSGDLQYLLTKIDKMEAILAGLQAMVCTMSSTIRAPASGATNVHNICTEPVYNQQPTSQAHVLRRLPVQCWPPRTL